jgi:type II secretory pathway pseudopilin PulG
MIRPPADRATVRTRLRTQESGFGLVELLVAIVLLNVGLLALAAAFNSGVFALRRAGQNSTASALAEKQMETLRAITYAKVALDPTLSSTDAAYTAAAPPGSPVQATCSPVKDYCYPMRIVTGPSSPDGRTYRIDTYIVTPAGTNPPKTVRIIVRDGNDLSRRLVSYESTFHFSSGS